MDREPPTTVRNGPAAKVPTQAPGSARQPGKPRLKRAWPLGLQGRLVAAFILLLMLGLEADGLLYASQTRERLVALLGEQARQLAWGLSLASQQPLAGGQTTQLRQIGQDMLRTRNVLFVVFYDANFHPVAFAHRDPDYTASDLTLKVVRPSALMQTHLDSSPVLGDFVQVVAPILGPRPISKFGSAGNQRLLGYVAVGVSQTPNRPRLFASISSPAHRRACRVRRIAPGRF
jgi:hypothetical protein